MDLNVLVTGAAGFAGRHLLARLVRETGAFIVAVDIADSLPDCDARDCKNIQYLRLDLSDPASTATLHDGCRFDAVVHLAARISQTNEPGEVRELMQFNSDTTLRLLQLAHAHDARFVFPSTALVYGGNPAPFTEDMRPDPAGFYALSKHFGEVLVRYFGGVHKLSWLILRIGILYGPAQNPGMFIPSLVTSLLRGEAFEMTEGRQVRDFVYIDDVTDAVVRSLAQRTVCGVFNIGSGTAYSMRETAETIQRLVGVEGLLRPGTRAYRTDEVWDYRLDITRTRKVLGWEPAIAFEDGLRRTIEYYRDRGTDTTRA